MYTVYTSSFLVLNKLQRIEHYHRNFWLYNIITNNSNNKMVEV